jgi:hypothetical protein
VSATYGVLNPGLAGTPLATQMLSFSGLAGGVLLAAVLGPRIWAAGNSEATRHAAYRVKIMAATAAGCGIGFLAALSNSTSTGRGTDFGWYALITTPLMVAGAAGIAFVLAGTSGGRAGAFALTTALFAGAFWLGITFGVLSKLDGPWPGLLFTLGQGMWAPAAASVVVGAAAWIRPARWRPPPRDLLMVAAVTVAVIATTVAMRLSNGPASVDTPESDWWAAAASGLVVAVVLLAVAPGRGARYALAATPIAVLATSMLTWVRYPAGFRESGYAISHFLTVPLTMTAIAFLLFGALLAVAMAADPANSPGTRPGPLPMATALTSAVLGSIGAALTLEAATAVLTFPTIS